MGNVNEFVFPQKEKLRQIMYAIDKEMGKSQNWINNNKSGERELFLQHFRPPRWQRFTDEKRSSQSFFHCKTCLKNEQNFTLFQGQKSKKGVQGGMKELVKEAVDNISRLLNEVVPSAVSSSGEQAVRVADH